MNIFFNMCAFAGIAGFTFVLTAGLVDATWQLWHFQLPQYPDGAANHAGQCLVSSQKSPCFHSAAVLCSWYLRHQFNLLWVLHSSLGEQLETNVKVS